MLSRISWTLAAWEDYPYWQGQDRKTLKRLNRLIDECLREPFAGILIYRVDGEDLVIIACRYHYD